jgi:hypothetical protein
MNMQFRSEQFCREREDESNQNELTSGLNLKYLIQGEVESNPKESTSDSDLNNLIEVG